jgi:hypothetical protein
MDLKRSGTVISRRKASRTPSRTRAQTPRDGPGRSGLDERAEKSENAVKVEWGEKRRREP